MNVVLDTKSNENYYLLFIDDAEPLMIPKCNSLEQVKHALAVLLGGQPYKVR